MSTLPPLTHHEILAIVGPFTRAGRSVDLAASDRAARRLAFRPVWHDAVPGAEGGRPPVQESLVLEHHGGDDYTLTRRLHGPGGRTATLVAEGTDPGELLARLQDVPLQRQWVRVQAIDLALSHRAVAAAGAVRLVLQQAVGTVAGITVQMKVSSVRGFPAELRLERGPGDDRRLPDDVLQVLGRGWDRLTPMPHGWIANVALPKAEPARSDGAEARLRAMVVHLQRTLAEPPSRYHQRHRAARWRVALMRTLPLGIGLAVTAVALWARQLGPDAESVLALLANIAPPLLLGLFFLQREMPRIELPRVPLPPKAAAWAPWAELPASLPPDR